MRERFLFTFLFHMVSVSLVLLPKQLKGPVLAVINRVISVTVVDAVAMLLILAGSVFLYLSLFKFLKSQPKCVESARKITNQPAEKAH